MASYPPMKLKRKDLDGVNDDFSDFSLTSPARKIRRLDADLSPIIEEHEPEAPFQFQHQPVPEPRRSVPVIQELSPDDENHERAIVLFKPVNSPLCLSPSQFIVDSNLMSAIRDEALWRTNSNTNIPVEDDESKANECLSVIPWVPSHPFLQQQPIDDTEEMASEPMDAEEMGSAPMETGDVAATSGLQSVYGYNPNENMHQQQQHCMIPQPPQNTITPIVWYR